MLLDVPSAPRIAVATCRAVPDLDDDGPLLLAALADRGVHLDVRVWDEPDADWSPYALVLVRSTWDYMLRREQFLAWVQRCRRTSNPAVVLSWNTDKHYLQDLERAGVPVVPAVFLEPGEPFTVPSAWPSGDVVV